MEKEGVTYYFVLVHSADFRPMAERRCFVVVEQVIERRCFAVADAAGAAEVAEVAVGGS